MVNRIRLSRAILELILLYTLSKCELQFKWLSKITPRYSYDTGRLSSTELIFISQGGYTSHLSQAEPTASPMCDLAVLLLKKHPGLFLNKHCTYLTSCPLSLFLPLIPLLPFPVDISFWSFLQILKNDNWWKFESLIFITLLLNSCD